MWFLMVTIQTALAVPTAAQMVQRQDGPPIVIAHRGASKAAPENTLAAYVEAITQGAQIAETDVHLSKDGTVVVLHDKTLDRTTGGEGPVADVPLAQLRTLDAGSWFSKDFSGERIPTLSELLGAVRDRMVLCIEIKADPGRGGENIAVAIRDALDASGGRDQAIIFSFYPQQIAAAKSAMPEVPALFLVRPSKGPIPYPTGVLTMARSLGADLIGIDHRRTTPEFVAQAHSAGFAVFVYTVDSEAQIQAMVAAGVDGIITNAPASTQQHVADITRTSR
jgi:glycerophosphoryl diester phosphodiesterase